MRRLAAFMLLSAASVTARAAGEATATASAGSMLQVLFGLALVLGLMVGAAWLMKRLGMARPGGSDVVKVIGGVSVGNRERVMVVEVGEQWIVVGVAPGRVNALSTLPRGSLPQQTEPAFAGKNFPAWLKQTMDKRNNSGSTGNTGNIDNGNP
ncbi:flagellar protein FliO/FliZ [Noviherbaspirillum humi]|uniref:Flagellar protein n=1 Tax=Noviherbaspirillum humi TaxID=1688639 RepID=A0A239FYG8_9BURK|nr:flagellar biosynthetic protein FliO [Noviherbaspirillum humi]SNS61312.1 flagellar protein FliO/FliZ [Noviherbaspirillum humi]